MSKEYWERKETEARLEIFHRMVDGRTRISEQIPSVESEARRQFTSNCILEAIKAKLRNWNGTGLVAILNGWHFHMMWFDRRTGEIRHFTNRNTNPNLSTTILFRGTVERVERDALEEFCRLNRARKMER